jgi:hypothetical protein
MKVDIESFLNDIASKNDQMKRSIALMTEDAKGRFALLYIAYSEFGERGLEIAEDLLDERSTIDSRFDQEQFWDELQRRLQSEPETVEGLM